jgi:hypothetical protein
MPRHQLKLVVPGDLETAAEVGSTEVSSTPASPTIAIFHRRFESAEGSSPDDAA